MPLTSFRTEVAAPVALLWQMLLEKIERPDLYVPGVERVEIKRRLGPGCVERLMHLGGDRAVHEIITADEATHTVIFKLLDNPRYRGFVTNTIFADGGQVILDYTMNWAPRAAADEVPEANWSATLRGAVLHMKAMAEERARAT